LLNNKHLIYWFVFLTQFFFLPAFLSDNFVAKFFLIAFSISTLILLLHNGSSTYKIFLPLSIVAAIFSLVILSSFSAYHPPSAIVSGGVFLLLLIFGIFIVPNIFPRGLDCVFFSVFLVFIQIVSSLGLYQYLSFFFNGKTSIPLIPYLLPPNKGYRVAGIFGQPNLFALLLVIGILVFIFMHLHRPFLLNSSNKLISKVRYLPLMLTSLVFFLTGSRAGFLALFVSLLLIFLFFVNRGQLPGRSVVGSEILKVFLVIVAAYILCFLLNKYLMMIPGRDFTNVGRSADARFVFWTASLLIFFKYPLLGVGLDNFNFFLPKYTNAAHDLLGFVEYDAMGYTKWSHNELLQLFCETGGVLGGVVVGFLVVFLFKLIGVLRKNKKCSLRLFFAYLFLLPFIIQSMFSWPLRHPSLLLLFFLFIGSLLSYFPSKIVSISRWGFLSIRFSAICFLIVIILLGCFEFQMGSFFHNKKYGDNILSSFSKFEELVENPYLEHTLLLEAVPSYVYAVNKNKDKLLGAKVLPYAEKLVGLHGSHWQWFNLALLYSLLERNEDAMLAVDRAIFLRPMELRYWSFQHYLNMITASKKTGRPMREFLPIPPGGTANDLKGYFGFDDRIKIRM